jgi:hypothetical protein
MTTASREYIPGACGTSPIDAISKEFLLRFSRGR